MADKQIPKRIWDAANKICQAWDDPALTIDVATALMAERERAAGIVRKMVEPGTVKWAIATAILSDGGRDG